jgi:predicted kinase
VEYPDLKQDRSVINMKRLILVTSPPASGKTYISKQLARNLKHVVYLDKDTLIVLSKQIFEVAGQEYNRSSDFFEANIRDYEYMAIVDLAMEALDYDDIVLINAPFTREIRDIGYMNALRERLAEKDAKLTVIWVQTDVEVCRQRMIERNSDRDQWKLDHWEEYIAGVNFEIPEELDDPDCNDDLLIFKNSSDTEFQASMKEILDIIES